MTGATCPLCRRSVLQVITEGGVGLELNPDPVEGGNVVPVKRGGVMRARILGGSETTAEGPAWVKHVTTCPETPDARRRRAAAGPRCLVCTGPLDAALARIEPQYQTHPACDPHARADLARAELARARNLVRSIPSHEIVPGGDPGSSTQVPVQDPAHDDDHDGAP